LLACALPSASSAAVPEITRPVTDLVGEISSEEISALEKKLVQHRDKTGVQLAVLIVDTKGRRTIDAFAQEVFDKWGGGDAHTDRGALLILAIRDRRSRLHLGHGLEPLISDGEAGQMLDRIKPAMRAGDTGKAVGLLVEQVIERTEHIARGEAIVLRLPQRPPVHWAIIGLGLLMGWFTPQMRWWERHPRLAKGISLTVLLYLPVTVFVLFIFTQLGSWGFTRALLVEWLTAVLAAIGYRSAVSGGWRAWALLLVFLAAQGGLTFFLVTNSPDPLAQRISPRGIELACGWFFVSSVAVGMGGAMVWVLITGGLRAVGFPIKSDPFDASSSSSSSDYSSDYSGSGGSSGGGGASSDW
jgi:uncharacterized membrane protein YgcG